MNEKSSEVGICYGFHISLLFVCGRRGIVCIDPCPAEGGGAHRIQCWDGTVSVSHTVRG